jgi:hypothetical protein
MHKTRAGRSEVLPPQAADQAARGNANHPRPARTRKPKRGLNTIEATSGSADPRVPGLRRMRRVFPGRDISDACRATGRAHAVGDHQGKVRLGPIASEVRGFGTPTIIDA